MKKICSIFSIIILLITLNVTGESVVAATKDTSIEDSKKGDLFTKENLEKHATIKELEDGTLEIKPDNPEEFSKLAGYEKPAEDAVLDKVYVKPTKEAESINSQNEALTSVLPKENTVSAYNIGAEYLINITSNSLGTGDKIGETSNTCYSSSGCGSLAVNITVSEGRSAGYSVGAGISAEVISAEVGFNVTDTYQVNDRGNYTETNVPYRGTVYIQAYERIRIVGFEVYEDDVWNDDYITSGFAWKPEPYNVQFASWKSW